LRELRDGLSADAYWRAAIWKRVAVIFAGPGTNLVFAVVLLAVVLMVGVRVATLTVGEVSPGSPADLAGLREGDRIYAVDGSRVDDFEELYTAVQDSQGRALSFSVDREGLRKHFSVMPTQYYGENWAIGFRPRGRRERYGPVDAFGIALERTWFVTKAIGAAFARLATGEGRDEISSPVGITRVSSEAVESDFRVYLQLLAFISLSLALLNLLPLLPLDEIGRAHV
jgi:regulator of sigma E protease